MDKHVTLQKNLKVTCAKYCTCFQFIGQILDTASQELAGHATMSYMHI